MPDKRPKEDDNYLIEQAGEKKIVLDIFLSTLIQQLMGKTLDLARISGMSDRSLQQFERTIKNECYKTIGDGSKILKEYGYLGD